jgi:HEAT repeat protein
MLLWHRIRIRTGDTKARLKAIQALGNGSRERAVKPLFRCLSDPDARVRATAAKVLGQLQSERAFELLLEALKDPRHEVRRAAASALRYQGDSRACGALAGMLRDADYHVRSAVAAALRRLGWKPATDEERALLEVSSGSAHSATFAGHAAVTPLLETLQHQTGEMRRSAADALSFVNDPRAYEPLLNAANDPDPTVRVSAIHALGKAPPQPAISALLQLLARDADTRVRLAAVQVLVTQPGSGRLPLLLDLLRDSHFEIRQMAATALGKSGNLSLASALVPLLNDPDHDVRLHVAKALSELGSPLAIEGLVIALADEEKSVRQTAEAALYWIDPGWGQSQAARAVAGRLAQLLETRPEWVRASAKPLLAKLQEPPPTAPPRKPCSQPSPRAVGTRTKVVPSVDSKGTHFVVQHLN